MNATARVMRKEVTAQYGGRGEFWMSGTGCHPGCRRQGVWCKFWMLDTGVPPWVQQARCTAVCYFPRGLAVSRFWDRFFKKKICEVVRGFQIQVILVVVGVHGAQGGDLVVRRQVWMWRHAAGITPQRVSMNRCLHTHSPALTSLARCVNKRWVTLPLCASVWNRS